jgi:hypothetical protein
MMARQFNLTPSDWHEIWNALECSTGTQSKLALDGFETTPEQAAALTDTDWIEIYLCVRHKHRRLRAGRYGRDQIARDWTRQVFGIVQKLDPIRAEYIGGNKR